MNQWKGNTKVNKTKWPFILVMVLYLSPQAEAKPAAQNPFEAVGAGILSVANNVAEVFVNGAAVKRDSGIELPFVSTHGKTEIGFGNAMLSQDDSSEERKRRKRRSLQPKENAGVVNPSADDAACRGSQGGQGGAGGTGGTGGGGADGADAEQVRRRRAQMRNAQRKRQANQKKAKKFQENHQRKKRQADVSDIGNSVQNAGQGFAEQAKQFAEKVREVVQSFVGTVKEIAQNIKETFSSNEGRGGNKMGTNIPMPEDAEIIAK